MIIRLAAMYLLSLYFITTNRVTSGQVGAIIFLAGMMIEAAVSYWEGRTLLRQTIPEKAANHPVETKKQVLRFYKPLLYSSFIAIVIGPSINAMLGKTASIHLAIAAFAIAGSLTQLVLSFFTYIHQIVLNFYREDSRTVLRFSFLLGFIPGVFIVILSYSPLGPWFMMNGMGIGDELMRASLQTLRIFTILALMFPWLDFSNGLLMLRGQNKAMIWSQAANAIMTSATLGLCILLVPEWNGMIGALAQSLGVLAELCVVLFVLREAEPSKERLIGQQ